MKRARPKMAKLEAELVRLNTLVRERRLQLARLEECPNHDCECRHVWREVVETKLAAQVGKVREHVRNPSARTKKKSLRRAKRPRSRS
jgi:hypothetical protein